MTPEKACALRVLKMVGAILGCLTGFGAAIIIPLEKQSREKTGYGLFFDLRSRTQAETNRTSEITSEINKHFTPKKSGHS